MEENIVNRLRNRLADARSLGLKVRLEPLDNQSATWCEIAGIPTLFVDLSQPAGEQLQQVDDALQSFHQDRARFPIQSDIENRSPRAA
ncbi:MAG: hypothetical protein VX694_01410 [Planctomycetota bacterium]|nr:hypothetical protein [Planctomycetota bacterium]MEC7677899.1 hypothetical protein [Planctomycetota bacterium]